MLPVLRLAKLSCPCICSAEQNACIRVTPLWERGCSRWHCCDCCCLIRFRSHSPRPVHGPCRNSCCHYRQYHGTVRWLQTVVLLLMLQAVPRQDLLAGTCVLQMHVLQRIINEA